MLHIVEGIFWIVGPFLISYIFSAVELNTYSLEVNQIEVVVDKLALINTQPVSGLDEQKSRSILTVAGAPGRRVSVT